MIGSAIGAGMSAAVKVGGILASNAAARRSARRARKILAEQQKENQDWFDRRYNEDATQRADAQRLLTMTQEAMRNRNRQAAATAAVMGGTNESVAAEKAASARAMTDTASQIAAEAADRKDTIEQQYMANKESLNKQLIDVEMRRATAAQKSAEGLSSAGESLGSAVTSLYDAYFPSKTQNPQ